jgi:hypothetical protein
MEVRIMDEQRFDNIARRLGGIRSRRDALRTAGFGTVAAVFTALGLKNSALAQDVGIENHCITLGLRCENKKDCCGFSRKRRREIVCKLSNAGSGDRCCGQEKASCVDNFDCCLNYFCNINNECGLI